MNAWGETRVRILLWVAERSAETPRERPPIVTRGGWPGFVADSRTVERPSAA